jgi:hypothetical protein
VGALLLLNVMTTPHRPSCAPREGGAGEPIHHVEPAVEQRNRQRNPFRWGKGRTLGTTLLPRLLNHRPPIRRGVTWHDLHHQSPQGTVVACCAWDRTDALCEDVYVPVQGPDACHAVLRLASTARCL